MAPSTGGVANPELDDDGEAQQLLTVDAGVIRRWKGGLQRLEPPKRGATAI